MIPVSDAGTGDRSAEIAALIETLLGAEERLSRLTQGEVDSVSNAAGRTFLLTRAQERMRLSESVKQHAILNALPAQIALLDVRGCIVVVNEAWSGFARLEALHTPGHAIGVNYLEACDAAVGNDAPQAHAIASGVREVLCGESKGFTVEYPCHSPDAQRWFVLTVSPLADRPPTGAVVMHQNVTERVLAQEAIRQSGELLRAVSTGTPDTVFVKDREGKYLLCNDAFARFVGRPAEQMIGQDNTMLFGERCARELNAVDRQVMETDCAVASEDVLTGASGPRVFLSTKAPYRDEHGNVIGVIGVSRDITERKRSEQDLREGQALLSMSGRLAHVGSWAVDLPPMRALWSDVLASIHEEAEGFCPTVEQAFSYYAPEHREMMRKTFDACMLNGTPFDVEHEIVTARGRRIWVRAIGEAVRGADGTIHRIQGALQDLSERKKAERDLQQLADRLTNTLESITDGFLILDRAWCFTYVNNEAYRMLGRVDVDLIGRCMWDEFPQSVGTDFERGYRRAMEAKGGTNFEAFYSPWRAWISVHCYPSEEGISVYFRDCTERHRDQDALRDLNAELEARVAARTAELNLAREDAEQANRAKSSFLAAMSHEIRTPMNGVVGMIDVLEQSNLKHAQADIVRTVRESAYALLRIVDDVLDFSKIEAGYFHIDNEPMAIDWAVEKVCDTLDALSVSKGVMLRLFIDPAIPARVRGDASRLRQILLNLVGNAIKFSSGSESAAGCVHIRAVLVERDARVVNVEFSIADNGIGMDALTQSRLFTPFTQADDSTTRRFGGTGLGLSISNRLAGLMGSDIKVKSEPGLGSRFTMRLPFEAVSDDPATEADDTRLSGLRCVVVGELAGLADDLAVYLRHAGASVQPMRSLAAARDWFTSAVPGLHVVVVALTDAAQADQVDTCRQAWNERSGLDVQLVRIDYVRRDANLAHAPHAINLVGDALHRTDLINAVLLAGGRQVPDEDESAVSDTETMPAPLSAASGDSSRLILVAEDNEINQGVIRKQLALLGFTADIAENGRDALNHMHRANYALLLTDLHMPMMDGYELAAAIREEEGQGPRMPIVALTANALKGEARRCSDLGMNGYMTKPVQLHDLHAMLQKWMPASAKPAPLRRPRTVDGRAQAQARGAVRESVMPAADLSVLVALVGDVPEIIADLLIAYRRSAVQAGEAIRRGIASGDSKAVRDAAHSLKSGARAIGAKRLGNLCEAMEMTADASQPGDMASQLARLDFELTSVTHFLDTQ